MSPVEVRDRRKHQLSQAVLVGLFATMFAIAIYPALLYAQFRYFPVLKEFRITTIEVVRYPHDMNVTLMGKKEVVTVGKGFLLSGVLDKSKMYPLWACEFKRIDVSQINSTGFEQRVEIMYGDQPASASKTRRPGLQFFSNWYVERAPMSGDRLTMNLNIRHTCFGVFHALQQVSIDVDVESMSATVLGAT